MSVHRHRPDLIFHGFFTGATFHHRFATSRMVVRVLRTLFHVIKCWFGPESSQGTHGRALNRKVFGGVTVKTDDKRHLLSPYNGRTHAVDLMEGG
jgi:hypothetical protein